MNQAILNDIRSSSQKSIFPDNTPYIGISVRQVSDIAARYGIIGRHIEIAALENNIIPERYVRNMKLFSIKDQIALLKSTVSVIGVGGLGGLLSDMLARIGVGSLNLMDGDCFEDHNLNRQRFSREDRIGLSKAESAAQSLHAINSSIEIRVIDLFLDNHNAEMIEKSDVAADCLDSLKTRFMLETVTKAAKIPLVSAAIAGESGHVTTIFPEDPGLRLIYGEPEYLDNKGVEASLGCLSYAVNLLASLECSEIVKILLHRGTLLRNKLMLADLKDNTIEIVALHPAPDPVTPPPTPPLKGEGRPHPPTPPRNGEGSTDEYLPLPFQGRGPGG